MTDVTKPKFDPIPLPGSAVFATGGPRIGEPVPVPAPKASAGPVLANKAEAPSTPTPPAPAPSPAWVREALGKLVAPSRAKAAVLLAVIALAGGAYVARYFTGDPEGPAAKAVLDVAKPDPGPATAAAPQPLPLAG